MKRNILISLSVITLSLFPSIVPCSQAQEAKFEEAGFQNPPSSAKVHTWWHWLDGSITKDGITKDLESMHSQGIVQATILNIGLFGDRDFGVKKVRFGSDAWFEMFQWALTEAKRLQISIGVHNCDGWSSSGGPWITPEMSMKQFVWAKTIVKGGQKVATVLKEPYSLQNYYKDVAVVAYKTDETINSFQKAAPKIMLNDSIDASVVADGNPVSAIDVKIGDYFGISSETPMKFDKIAVHPRRSFMWHDIEDFVTSYAILSSEDGKTFTKIAEFSVKGLNKTEQIAVPQTTARFIRVLIADLSRIDAYLPVKIAEMELLEDGDTPTFNPAIPDITEKTASTKASQEQAFYTTAKSDAIRSIPSGSEVAVLTGKMDGKGVLNWDAPEGNWAILRFGYTTTGAINQPATKEGTGLECDKMDSMAADLHFNNFSSKLIEKAGAFTGNTFKFILIDSWECGYQNWSRNFPEEFKKRRGYDLIPYLPVLCGTVVGSAKESEAVLFDFRRTIADLIEENYYRQFSKLCHQNKLELHAEVIYGEALYPPLDILKATQCVDLPMWEYWTATNSDNIVQYKPSSRVDLQLPACAATGYGKQVIAAESYTGMAHYSESPKELKPFGDWAYCSGVNQFILHSYVHQPTDDKPGMTLGQYASHFNRNNLTWPYSSEWLNYQSRVQYALQQGVVVQDLLYYLGDQLPQFCKYGPTNTLPFGYQINACNFDILKNRIRIVDGKIRLNDVSEYALLSLPSFPYMNLKTLQRIEALVKEGAIIYGPKPLYTLNKADLDNDKTNAFHELADQLWGKGSEQATVENRHGKGRVFWGMSASEVLKKIDLKPDFATDRQDAESFHFIHRKAADTDIYFVANQQGVGLTRDCLFRMADDRTPEIWNPEDGSMIHPAIFRHENGQIRIPVAFKPHESKLFVFKAGKPVDYISTVERDGKQIFPASGVMENTPSVSFINGGYAVKPAQTGDYTFITNSKRTLAGHYSQAEEVEVLKINGNIQFEAGYKADIPPVEISSLQSLSEASNLDIRYFSGNAHYALKFNTPSSIESSNDAILLDIGDFGSVARVTLNGKSLGDLWKPHTRLNVTGLLRAENELKITVANVYRNRLIGDFVQFGKIQSVRTSSPIEKFLDKNKSLLPSGLLGPVELIKVKQQVIP
jgi:hypothetical protein